MPDIQAPITALELCFEEELSHVPGWHSQFLELEHSHNPERHIDTDEDKLVEESMLLGA